MRLTLAWFALAACGGSSSGPPPPPPIVSSLDPQSGPWGTEVTIEGENFGDPGTVAFDGRAGTNGFVVSSWTDTEIKGRIAFPGTGNLVVSNDAGDAAAGAFTAAASNWAPGDPARVAFPLDGIALPTGEIACVFYEYQQATLVVYGATPAAFPLTVGIYDTSVVRLVEADDHTPEVVATLKFQGVWSYGLALGQLVATQMNQDGGIVAVGRDASGLYAWIQQADVSTVERLRLASLAVERGPITMPTDRVLDAALAVDGTLWIVYGGPIVSVAALAPNATAFRAPENVNTVAYTDTITGARIRIAPDGLHMVVSLTTTGTAPPARSRTAAGSWADASSFGGVVHYAFAGSTLAALVNDAATRTLSWIPDVSQPANAEVIPVWPMTGTGLILDAVGKPRVLASDGVVTYALTPPP